MICGHLDNADLDALPYNHAHAIEVARQAREARAILVDRLLGTQSAEDCIVRAEKVTAMAHLAQEKGPIGL